jgi:hypothetical protein
LGGLDWGARLQGCHEAALHVRSAREAMPVIQASLASEWFRPWAGASIWLADAGQTADDQGSAVATMGSLQTEDHSPTLRGVVRGPRLSRRDG